MERGVSVVDHDDENMSSFIFVKSDGDDGFLA